MVVDGGATGDNHGDASNVGGPGSLFVVSTPIGNLGDITLRAIDVLRSVDLILAEDTRHSRHLLTHHDIRTPVHSYHEHNEARATAMAMARLQNGRDVALISDAGTPLLSDPGARLVRAAADAGVRVVPVPGASALLAALVVSGVSTERFTFFGFLPRKGREREAALRELSSLPHTAVIYEAPNRVGDTLRDLVEQGAGQRTVVVARELTKQFEEVRRGTVSDLAAYYQSSSPRGEVVIVLEGRADEAPGEDELRARARALRSSGMSRREVIATLVNEGGASRNLAYRLAHES